MVLILDYKLIIIYIQIVPNKRMCSYNLLNIIYNWMLDYIGYHKYYCQCCQLPTDIDVISDGDVNQGVMVDIDSGSDSDDEYCVIDINGLP